MTESEPKLDVDVVFLGGVFLSGQLEMIQRDSKGVVQNAADALQKALLSGLAQRVTRVRVVNLPFVGSYPRTYRSVWFPAAQGEVAGGVPVDGIGFLNLNFIKRKMQFVAVTAGLIRAMRSIPRHTTIVVYSAYLPFLAAARLARWWRPNTHLCAIIPDLPEFMGEGGRAFRIRMSVESYLFRRLVRKFNSFVFLTDATGERLGVPRNRRTVVEGIYSPPPEGGQNAEGRPDHPPAILYTGTLESRYGIADLLDAFRQVRDPKAQLWICGDGDARPSVEAMARSNPRVRFFGQVPRSQALDLQRRAAILVNPRRPEGEFTKYSFPSKTIEYLASGRPVVMYALPGIPPEYLDYLIVPDGTGPTFLAQTLDEVLAQSDAWRASRGEAGRLFVQNQKSPYAQVGRVVRLWIEKGGMP